MAEYRISIYGRCGCLRIRKFTRRAPAHSCSTSRLRRNTGEWDKLAKWVIKNELFSDNVRWLIQIPRLYDVFKKSGGVKDFEEVVRSTLQMYLHVLRRPP